MSKPGFSWLPIAWLAACGPHREVPMKAEPGNMTPHVERSFVAGPKLSPTGELSRWLDAKKDTALLRVPATITRGGLGDPSRAKLGELEIRLDTGALGISLEDRLNEACPGRVTCRVWLEGRWSSHGELRVLYFARAVRPDEAADFVEVER